jgi:hypothetical protein
MAKNSLNLGKVRKGKTPDGMTAKEARSFFKSPRFAEFVANLRRKREPKIIKKPDTGPIRFGSMVGRPRR